MGLKSFALAIAAVAGLAISANVASAQENCKQIALPNGTVLTCTLGTGGTKVYVDALGNVYPATSTGAGTFTVTNSGSNPCQATLAPVAINISSTAGAFGNVSVTLDGSRPATPSIIVSQGGASAFPATEDFYFQAFATVSSLPGRRYRSIREFHFSSRNVRSFAPHKNERFGQVGQVDFEDVNRPGVVVFTVQNTSITLN